MEHIFKALNDALSSKEFQIRCLNEDITRLRKERDELQAENDKVRAYIEQLNNDEPAEEEEEDF